jgi:hypothetical protein
MKLLSRTILALVATCWLGQDAQAQMPTEPWTFSVSLSGSYEGNALFVGADEGEEFAHQLAATIGRSWALRRGSVDFHGTASQPFYQQSTSLNDFRYDVGAGLSYALTRRLSLTADGTVSSGLARDSEVLTDAGLVLPSSARSSNLSGTLAYMLTPRSTLSWQLSQQGAEFSSILFTGGTSVASVLSWTRQLTTAQTVGVSQEYLRTFTGGRTSLDGTSTDGTTSSIHGLLGTWSFSAQSGWTANVSAGVKPYSVPGESHNRMSTALFAGLSKPVRRGQTLGVTYSQSVEQTFGAGRNNHLVQTIAGNYELSLARNLTSSFGGSHSHGTNPVNDQSSFGQAAQASLMYRVMPNMGVSFGSSFYSRTDPPADRVSSYSTFISVTYGTRWR